MAFKFDPLKDRKKNKSFFVGAESEKKEKEKEQIEENLIVQNANHNSQNAKQEMQSVNSKMENITEDPIVFLSSRVYKSQDKWLDSVIEQHREMHGRKLIKKEDLIKAAINLLKSKDIDWKKVKSEEDLNSLCLNKD